MHGTCGRHSCADFLRIQKEMKESELKHRLVSE